MGLYITAGVLFIGAMTCFLKSSMGGFYLNRHNSEKHLDYCLNYDVVKFFLAGVILIMFAIATAHRAGIVSVSNNAQTISYEKEEK